LVSPVDTPKRPEEIVAADLAVLRAYEEHPDRDLPKGRLTRAVTEGLDAMAMAVLPDMWDDVKEVARRLGRDEMGLRYVLQALGRDGTWKHAGEIADAKDMAAQTHVVLSSLERDDADTTRLTPSLYAADKARIIAGMKTFKPETLREIRRKYRETVGKPAKMRLTKKTPVSRDIIVPIVGKDVPPIALAVAGYLGCVREVGGAFIAESSYVSDDVMSKHKLVKETRRDGKDVWFTQGEASYGTRTKPAAERLDDGKIAFTDKILAVRVAADAIDNKTFAECYRIGDKIMSKVDFCDDDPDKREAFLVAAAKRYELLATHFGGTVERVSAVPADLPAPPRTNRWITERDSNPNLLVMKVGERTYVLNLVTTQAELYVNGAYKGGNHDLAFHEIADQLDRGGYSGIN